MRRLSTGLLDIESQQNVAYSTCLLPESGVDRLHEHFGSPGARGSAEPRVVVGRKPHSFYLVKTRSLLDHGLNAIANDGQHIPILTPTFTSALREGWAALLASHRYQRSSAVRLRSKGPPRASAWSQLRSSVYRDAEDGRRNPRR